MKFDRLSQLDEISEKKARLTRLMNEHQYDAVIFSKRNNFAWATGGADNHVRHASELGVASLVFFKDGRRLVLTTNIEAPRIMSEEVAGLGFDLEEVPWYEKDARAEVFRRLLRNMRVASDDGTPGTEDIEQYMTWQRLRLGKHEMMKFRWLGRASGKGIGEACKRIARGMTEEEIAGSLFAEMQKQGVKPSVLLIAADDRILKYRHPIPTGAKVKNAVMVVMCARRWGLVVSVTRLVHFGKMSAELCEKHAACAFVDATMIAGSVPGTPLAEVFRKGCEAYAQRGFRNEWHKHHQGGPTAYVEREIVATPDVPPKFKVEANMAFAWNPSITGTKSEDTILVTSRGQEIITATPGWPTVKMVVGKKTVQRPNWLVKG